MDHQQSMESTLRAREEELAKLLEMKKYSASVLESMEKLAESFRVLVDGSEASSSTSRPWEDVSTLLAASAAASAAPVTAATGTGAGAGSKASDGFLVMAYSEIDPAAPVPGSGDAGTDGFV